MNGYISSSNAAATDPYPSRIQTGPRLLPRAEPVVYEPRGALSEPTLSEASLARYERDGYLFVEELIAQDLVDECLTELNRLRARLAGSQLPEVVTEPDGPEVRSIFRVHRLSPVFARLAFHPAVLGAAQRILGSELYVHQSRVNIKPAFRGREFYWHSDFETWHAEDGMPRMRALSCSVSLTENNEFNGPLMVIPGSHKVFVSCVGETPKRNYERSLKRQEIGVPDDESLRTLAARGGVRAPKGKPGSVLFFDCNLLHGSASNISPYPRSNAFFVYNSVFNPLEQPFCGLPPRPEHIASRDFTPLAPEPHGDEE